MAAQGCQLPQPALGSQGHSCPWRAADCGLPPPHPPVSTTSERQGSCWQQPATAGPKNSDLPLLSQGRGSLELDMTDSAGVCDSPSYLKPALLSAPSNHRTPGYSKNVRSHVLGPQAAVRDYSQLPRDGGRRHRSPRRITQPASRPPSDVSHPIIKSCLEMEADSAARTRSIPLFENPLVVSHPSPLSRKTGPSFPLVGNTEGFRRPADSSPQERIDLDSVLRQALPGARGLRCQFQAVSSPHPCPGGTVLVLGESQEAGCWRTIFSAFLSCHDIGQGGRPTSARPGNSLFTCVL